MNTADWEVLKQAALTAQRQAYAPYSNYAVGAALSSPSGQVFVGANVENASYGLTICAERTAVTTAVVSGVRTFKALALVTRGPEPATPCGACRQVLREFGQALPILCFTQTRQELMTDLTLLLPSAFTLP